MRCVRLEFASTRRTMASGYVGFPPALRVGVWWSPDGDHRIAMLGALLGLCSREGVAVEGAECVSVSFPGFFEVLESLRAG